MKVDKTIIPGALVIEPKVFGDARGFFMETWQRKKYEEIGLPGIWEQDNLSLSRNGILRGLHMQNPHPQGKLVSVLRGEVFDVAVDLRLGSPAFGKWTAVVLSSENKMQFYIPPGCAHGFVVTSDEAVFSYKCTDTYDPSSEITLSWDDPDLAIEWPHKNPLLSPKDQKGLRLKDIPKETLLNFPI